MEVQQQLTSEWCFEQRDAAFAAGDINAGDDYQSLGQMWAEREKKGATNEATKESTQ